MMLYECGVRYERTMANGITKKVTELYLVDALSFTEAEGRITKEMEPFYSGDFDVVTIKRTNYSEIAENDKGDKWFRAKLLLSRSTTKAERRRPLLTSSSVPPTSTTHTLLSLTA